MDNNKKTIFDLGFHNGNDTANYLSKGYNVIAVEADPFLASAGLKRFKDEHNLIILNAAFCSDINAGIPFYVFPDNRDWSTADKAKADYRGIDYETKIIPAINYKYLIRTYGIPYYIKCDIEGFDYLLIKQICEAGITPEYLSLELSRLDYYKIFSYLFVAGYTAFQLRNQANNPEYSSGEFGEYLPHKEWLSFDECLTRYMKYKELKAIDNINLALGWIDINAKK
jgi:FkbM family methyltransferase